MFPLISQKNNLEKRVPRFDNTATGREGLWRRWNCCADVASWARQVFEKTTYPLTLMDYRL